MRLLFCCEYYHPSVGGVQMVMRQLAERLVLRGHAVTVATTRLPERQSLEINGVEIVDFDISGNGVKGLRGEVDRFRAFVRGFDGDAILIKAAQQWTFDALWPILDDIRARKVFIPCGFSGLFDPLYGAYFEAMPKVLAAFDSLIFYASQYRDIDFARRHGLQNLVIIPNGASEIEFADRPDAGLLRHRLGIGADDFVFLTVGNRSGLKGHAEVAEAYARMDARGRPTTLILNGNRPAAPPEAGGWKARRRRLKAGLRRALDRCLRGRLPPRSSEERIDKWARAANGTRGKRVIEVDLAREDVLDAFFAADLFVFASNVEYSPLVLFESVAAGTPFLSVPVGNAVEIAAWTGAGLICPATTDPRGRTHVDPGLLATAMENAAADPDALRALGRVGRARWRQHFTWAAIAERYEAVLSGKTIADFE